MEIPPWAINKVQSKVLNSNQEDDSNNNLQNKATTAQSAQDNNLKLGTKATKVKQTPIKVQAQQQQPVQDQIPPWVCSYTLYKRASRKLQTHLW